MPIVKFDVSDSDPDVAVQGGGEPAPVGTYHCQISSVVDEQPEGKDRRLHCIYRIVDHEGYSSLHDYISFGKSSEWKMDQFLQAIGAATKTKRSGGFDPDKQKNKDVNVFVRNESYDPGDGTGVRTTAKVGGVYKWNGKAGGPKAAPAAEETEPEEEDRWDEIVSLSEDDLSTGEYDDVIQGYGEPYGLDDGDAHDTWTEWVAAISEAIAAGGDTEEEEPEPEEEEEEEEEEVDEVWQEFLGMEEEDLEANSESLSEYADTYALDPNDYDTWAGLVEAINEAMNGGEPDDAPDGDEADYSGWTIKDINAELTARGLATGGSKDDKIGRLEEDDAKAGPFES